MKQCPNCGEELKDNYAQDGFCNYCGEDFDPGVFSKGEKGERTFKGVKHSRKSASGEETTEKEV
ncbi:MAG: hypothetical protein HYS55_03785 [Candidatus Omnitrophica bacterium]|nr:hypothetical protein [Candidatus Omnitrophota bacterium]